jgi:hypothetical protein
VTLGKSAEHDTSRLELVGRVLQETLEKVSSNGQIWAYRLAGADVMTKYHAYSIVEAMRLEWGRLGVFESDLLRATGQDPKEVGKELR